jgi:MFS family permease
LSDADGMTERVTFGQVFAQPVFRVVFLTRSLAIGADTLRMVALSVLVYSATGSALLGALAFGISFAPQVIGGLLLGALPDRVRPRLLLVAGCLVEAAVAGVLGLVTLPVWASLTLVGAVAAFTPVLNGANGRVIADVLDGEAYVLGRTMSQLAISGAQILGMAGGGVAVAALGPQAALLVVAGCHLAAGLATWLFLPNLPAAGTTGQSLVRQSWLGNRLLLADRRVRRLLLAWWLPPAFATAANSLLVPYGAERGWSPGAPGLVLAWVPVGMIVGDLVVGRWLRQEVRDRLAGPLAILVGGVPLVPFVFDLPVPLAGALLAVAGCGYAYTLCLQRAFREAAPRDARGQAFGLVSTGLMTVQGLGPLAWGVLAEAVSTPVAMALGGVAVVAVGCWLTGNRALLRVQALAAAGQRDADGGVVVGAAAGTEAEREPAGGDPVQRGDLPGQQRRLRVDPPVPNERGERTRHTA